jgi:uncharacterized protein
MFIGRQREIRVLEKQFDSAKPSLSVMYGRRRVGKSALLQRVLDGRDAVYFQATRITDGDSRLLLQRAIAQGLGEHEVLRSALDWEGIFRYLRDWVTTNAKPLVIAIDEFPYLCEDNKALPSILQKVWDEVVRTATPLKLVLCGSAVSYMEGLLYERNPLHGRQTCELDLGPLPFRDAAQFLPGWSAVDALRAYGVLGGMPYYLSLCDPGQDLAGNVCRLVLEDGAPLRDEAMQLLQAELNSPARFAGILRAVADGLTERGEIMNRVMHKGEQGTSITPYIDRLEGMRLLRRMHSLEVAPERSRNARYYLDDPFLAFHFRFVLPNVSALQSGHADTVWKNVISPWLDEYMGNQFEDICRGWLALYGQERLGMAARKVGKIWAADYDIDVAGELLDDRTVAGECKWWKNPAGFNVLADLKRDSARAKYYAGTEPLHLLFARSGFTPELRAAVADDPGVLLLTPDELVQPPA